MRSLSAACLVTAFALFSGAALADDVLTVYSGPMQPQMQPQPQIQPAPVIQSAPVMAWQPRCQEPAMPPSLITANSETPANQMNTLMEQYNAYAGQMQEYMNCVSSEAQTDATAASQSILQAASMRNNEAQRKVNDLRDRLQVRQQQAQ